MSRVEDDLIMALNAMRADRDALEVENARLREVAEQALDALIWCSGSPDFTENGQAHEGWHNLGRPAIEALLAVRT